MRGRRGRSGETGQRSLRRGLDGEPAAHTVHGTANESRRDPRARGFAVWCRQQFGGKLGRVWLWNQHMAAKVWLNAFCHAYLPCQFRPLKRFHQRPTAANTPASPALCHGLRYEEHAKQRRAVRAPSSWAGEAPPYRCTAVSERSVILSSHALGALCHEGTACCRSVLLNHGQSVLFLRVQCSALWALLRQRQPNNMLGLPLVCTADPLVGPL